MFKIRLFMGAVVLMTMTLVLGGCTPPQPCAEPQTEKGTLQVFVTDARSRDEVTGIVITVSEVQVHKTSTEQEQEQEQEQQQTQQGEGEWVSIIIDEGARTFDLLDIEGIEQYLGQIELEAVKYTQVRLVVESAQVELNNSGNLQDARVPSGELKIVHPFNVIRDQTSTLVIDFDADKMVNVTGSGEIIVKPVVKLKVRQAGSQGQNGNSDEASSLEDTRWILQAYGESGSTEELLADTEITAEFVSSSGTVEGSAGCNTYFSGYEVNGSQVSVPGSIAVTEMYCMEPEGVMDQEQEYLTLLAAADRYQIDGNELQIFCGAQVLIFTIE